MPEDSKKNQHKTKHNAKEQRKPRQSRHVAEKPEKKHNKKDESNVPIPTQSKPTYDEPGPEFYKNLKRETDDILKITEEDNAKYKQKEIQSNWSKYEMPIESYEEIEEQENIGADYEKLIQTPLSIGGHFQFKHEKSWDVDTAPSLYDKYFEINMENLATAINTIPFYERNSIDKSVFSDTDITTMNSRTIKYKRKYYNDKSYTTAELEVPELILNNTRDSMNENEGQKLSEKKSEPEDINLEAENPCELTIDTEKVNLDNSKTVQKTSECDQSAFIKEIVSESTKLKNAVALEDNDIDEIILGTKTVNTNKEPGEHVKDIENNSQISPRKDTLKDSKNPTKKEAKPALETPEDLEKWLDDFLDG